MLDRERLSAITDNVVYDEPMSKHTTFRIGGTADAFVSPENALEIEKLFILQRYRYTVYAYGQRLKYACR